MRVLTYTSDDPGCPPLARAVARIRCAMVGVGGSSVMDWHPVIVTAPTAAEAEAKALEFWRVQVVAWQAMTPRQRDNRRREIMAGEEAGVAWEDDRPAAAPEKPQAPKAAARPAREIEEAV